MRKILCTIDGSQISDSLKKKLEAAFRTHYARHLTPSEKLTILWCELPAEQGFTNYEQPCVSLIVIEAQDGLDQAARERMLADCARDWSRITRIPQDRLMISVFDASEFADYMAANQRRLSGFGRIRFVTHLLFSLMRSKASRGVLAFHPNLGS